METSQAWLKMTLLTSKLQSQNISYTCLKRPYFLQDCKGVFHTGIHQGSRRIICKFWILNAPNPTLPNIHFPNLTQPNTT
jgi:hypothetical protein